MVFYYFTPHGPRLQELFVAENRGLCFLPVLSVQIFRSLMLERSKECKGYTYHSIPKYWSVALKLIDPTGAAVISPVLRSGSRPSRRKALAKKRISKQASQPALLSGFSFLMNDLPSEASAVYQILRRMTRNGNPIVAFYHHSLLPNDAVLP